MCNWQVDDLLDSLLRSIVTVVRNEKHDVGIVLEIVLTIESSFDSMSEQKVLLYPNVFWVLPPPLSFSLSSSHSSHW